MIFKNKNNSRSSQQKNLTVSKLVHLENNDKISSRRMKILKTSLTKISRINEKAKHKNWNSQRVYVFQQRMKSLNFTTIIFRFDIVFATAKLAQFFKKLEFDLCDDRKQNDYLFE